jgi:cytochrome c peroxidase
MKNTLKISLLLSVVLIYIGCKKAELEETEYSQSPVLPETVYDYESSNDHQVTLGRVLFYDQKLSLNNSVSCGSCHQQSKAFCDNKQFSTGLQDQKTRRNTPSIVRHFAGFFWDSRAMDYMQLAAMPLINHVEMHNYDLTALENKVASIGYYPQLFTNAFGSSEVTMNKIQSAIAQFLENIDFSQNQMPNAWSSSPNTLSAMEEAGRQLFIGKAKCGNCHAGTALGGWFNSERCIGLDESYEDNGLGERTGNPKDNGRFHIPPLFNIEYTAPYMHDGRFKTLEEVVEHYNSGIKAHPNLSIELQSFPGYENLSLFELTMALDVNHNGQIDDEEVPPGTPIRMNLTELEKKSLVAFLKALSDPRIFTDVRFSDPFRIRN